MMTTNQTLLLAVLLLAATVKASFSLSVSSLTLKPLLRVDPATLTTQAFRSWIQFRDHVYFTYHDSERGVEIYRANEESIELFLDTLPNNGEVFSEVIPHGFANLNDKLLFILGANDRLWVTDGTIESTKDITPWSDYQRLGSKLFPFLEHNTVLFMQDTNRLWASDGTQSGTRLIHEFIYPSPRPPIYFELVYLDGKAYFWTEPTIERRPQLWSIDLANNMEVSFVKDIPLTYLLDDEALIPLGDGKLLIRGPNEILRTNVSPDGALQAIYRAAGNSTDFFAIGEGMVFQHKYYFYATDDGATGNIYSTDGSVEGTKVVAQSLNGWARFVAHTSDYLYYEVNGHDLVRTDGTGTNTITLLSDHHFYKRFVTVGEEAVFFGARPRSLPYGFELFVTDGSVEGTAMVANINTLQDTVNADFPDASDLTTSPYFAVLEKEDFGILYFVASNGADIDLYKVEVPFSSGEGDSEGDDNNAGDDEDDGGIDGVRSGVLAKTSATVNLVLILLCGPSF